MTNRIPVITRSVGDGMSGLNGRLFPITPNSPADVAALYRAGKFGEVACQCESRLSQDPRNHKLLNLIAYIRHQLGDVCEAAALLRSSLEIDPHQPVALNNYGVALQDLEQPSQALIRFNQALALVPRFVFAQYNRLCVGAELKALATFERALGSNPGLARFETRPPAYIFCYHKTGTVLFFNIMQKLSARFGIITAERGRLINRLFRKKHMVLFYHSDFADRVHIELPFRAVRIVRDPRDIWVSNYLYHRTCQEPFCVHTQFNTTGFIGFPQVDDSMIHRPELWKQEFLKRLDRKSYQQNLLDRDQEAGLQFELEGYTDNTLNTMRCWVLREFSEVLQIKLEDIISNFDESMALILRHFGFSEEECKAAIEVAQTEDVNRMSDAEIAANTHVYSKKISKWQEFLTPRQLRGFELLYGDLITDLGYKLSS